LYIDSKPLKGTVDDDEEVELVLKMEEEETIPSPKD